MNISTLDAEVMRRAQALGIVFDEELCGGGVWIYHPEHPHASMPTWAPTWGLWCYRWRMVRARPDCPVIAQIDGIMRWYIEQPEADKRVVAPVAEELGGEA